MEAVTLTPESEHFHQKTDSESPELLVVEDSPKTPAATNGQRHASSEIASEPSPLTASGGEKNKVRKRKVLSEEERRQIAEVRKLGACDACRRRKTRCQPDHHRDRSASESEMSPIQTPQRALQILPAFNQPSNGFGDQIDRSMPPPPRPRSSLSEVSRPEEAVSKTPELSERKPLPVAPSAPPQWNRVNQQTDLNQFGHSLQRVADTVFPNSRPSRSKYSSVHVLLLHWEEKDPRSPVAAEIDELYQVFSDRFNFEVSTGQIPSDGPSKWLFRKIIDFIEVENDAQDVLKIVYYIGGSFLSKSRQPMWTSNSRNGPSENPVANMQGVQTLLEEARSDVLLLLDACTAGFSSGGPNGSVTEVIAATGSSQAPQGVGLNSFSSVLAKELSALSSRGSFTISELYLAMLSRMQSHMETDNRATPLHLALSSPRLPRSIILSPLQRTKRMRSEEPHISLAERSGVGHPQINLSIRLADPISTDSLSADLFIEWLRTIPFGAEKVKIEARYAGD